MRIGIVSPWMERGVAYVSLDMRNALAKQHEVFILTRPKSYPMGPEWDVPNVEGGGVGSFKFPLDWAERRQLDMVIFNERHDFSALARLRNHGFKLVVIHEWESVNPAQKFINAQNACWDGIIGPTRCAYERFREMGLENVYYVPWGTHLEVFHPPAQEREGPIRFFQPVNFGGVYGRKNLKATKEAWAHAVAGGNLGDATLTLALQKDGKDEMSFVRTKRGTLLRTEYAKLYREADVVLLPSMWEGLGLCFMEALASGCAIVTVTEPPMSDYVTPGLNGWCCRTVIKPATGHIYVDRALINIADYVRTLEYMVHHPVLTRGMGVVSRDRAEAYYNWDQNSEIFVAVIEEIANG